VLLGHSVTDVACALIVMLNSLLTFCTGFPASVTFTVKLNIPAAVGVPVIAPLVAFIANPVGRPPAVIDQLNGVVPPVVDKVAEYPVFTTPPGNVDVVITSGAACTVRVVPPLTLPMVADIVAVPAEPPDANPTADTVATAVLDDAQFAWLVRLAVVESEYVPVAVNCCVVPATMLGLVGVTAIDVNVFGACTVKTVPPLTLPRVADIVLVPVDNADASPVAFTLATPVFAEFQVAVLVRLAVVPSEYVPVAVNCCVAPVKMVGFAGVTAIDVNVFGACTVKTVPPFTLPTAAEMVLVPADSADARPVAFTLAADGFEELHVATDVKLDVPPFEYVPDAVNCCELPVTSVGFAGVTEMEVNVAGPVAAAP